MTGDDDDFVANLLNNIEKKENKSQPKVRFVCIFCFEIYVFLDGMDYVLMRLKEVKTAKKLIKTWMEIENESCTIQRKYYKNNDILNEYANENNELSGSSNENSDCVPTRLMNKLNTKIKNAKRSCELIMKQHSSDIIDINKIHGKPRKRNTFDAKFNRMKEQAKQRMNDPKYTGFKRHKTPKSMIQIENECKQQSINITPKNNNSDTNNNDVDSDDKNCDSDDNKDSKDSNLIFNGEDTAFNAKKRRRELKNMEMKKILLIQYKQITKYEEICLKNLKNKVFIEWKNQVKLTKIMNIESDMMYRKKIKEIRSIIFFEWKMYVYKLNQQRKIDDIKYKQQCNIAIKHYNRIHIIKLYKIWKEIIYKNKMKQQLIQQKNERQQRLKNIINNAKKQNKKSILIDKGINVGNSIEILKPNNMDIKISKKGPKNIKKVRKIVYKEPRILIKMNERAKLRKQKRDELKELKLKRDKERELKEKETKKRYQQERILKIKKENELKQQRLAEIKKEREIERTKILLSEMHYKRSNIIYRGWIPWMKYVELNRINNEKAMIFRQILLAQKVTLFNDIYSLIYI